MKSILDTVASFALRLRQLAQRRGISLNKLVEELSMRTLAETDAEAAFLIRAARGDRNRGLAILDELDRKHGKQ